MKDPRATNKARRVCGGLFSSFCRPNDDALCRRCSSTSTTTRSARSAGPKPKKELSDEEKEYKSKRKQIQEKLIQEKLIQEKLIKFATRIPAFMSLTDFRENTHQSGYGPPDTVVASES